MHSNNVYLSTVSSVTETSVSPKRRRKRTKRVLRSNCNKPPEPPKTVTTGLCDEFPFSIFLVLALVSIAIIMAALAIQYWNEFFDGLGLPDFLGSVSTLMSDPVQILSCGCSFIDDISDWCSQTLG